MKKIYTILILMVLATMAFSQSLRLLYNDETVTNQELTVDVAVNGSVNYDMDPNTIAFKIFITNATTGDISGNVRMEIVDIVEGAEAEFTCFNGACRPDATSHNFTIGTAGRIELNPEFKQGPNEGTSHIKYTFTVGEEEIFVTMKYVCGATGIAETAVPDIRMYPTPASSYFVVENNAYDNARVEVFNVLGMSVAKYGFGSSNTLRVDCSKWNRGCYFCRIYSNNEIKKTVKFIISK